MENGSFLVAVLGRKTEIVLQLNGNIYRVCRLPGIHISNNSTWIFVYKLHVFKIWTKQDSLYFERKLKMVIQQQSDDHNPLFSGLDAL